MGGGAPASCGILICQPSPKKEPTTMLRILSGIKPSGTLHIGNYLGMIRPMVESQKRGELYCFIANLHSLTTLFDGPRMAKNSIDAIVDMIALGIDPERSVFWLQSDVPEVVELTWYLNNVTPVGLLERCHAYKDAQAKGIPSNHGLFSYPVLMAADILLYQSNIVPVGKDQKQHVEVTRDIAIKFNSLYGEVFTLPEPEISEEIALIPGVDGQKMSKSYNNTIEIFGDEKATKKKIMGIITDPTPVEEPKDPNNSTIYAIYKLFADKDRATLMADRLRAGGYGYGDAKKELFEVLWTYFEPYRKKRLELADNLDYINDVKKQGAGKAREIAAITIGKVRELVGVL
ncbi:MAG: tryptophan--tRNA ligase [Chitinispirillales bacterium]|jgi:tryptophanyl-tRNA synthetase|nr:tryptophan--tRNA ligase [Chitinispirillales bacterium]